MSRLLVVALLVLCALPAVAQSPQGMDYTGGGTIIRNEVVYMIGQYLPQLLTVLGIMFAVLLISRLIFGISKG